MSEISKRKGIILAGGNGTRLYPITLGICKQLLPVYDKPMIYYPLSTLMLAGVNDVLIITKPSDKELFFNLLGNGSQWGIKINYEMQKKPNGISESLIIASEFIGDNPIILILGDNLFYGSDLVSKMKKINNTINGATIFAYPVKDPDRYGVVTFNKNGKVTSLEEKPKSPKSNYAVTGIYFFDNSAIDRAKSLTFSPRGELEITDLNKSYLNDDQLNVELISRGSAWLDTGTFESLSDANSFIRTLENRQGLKIGCPEEAAWRNGWINNDQLLNLSKNLNKSGYGDYLKTLI
tara:strand:+ start:24021 stop:24899 length:879 start_codon:yes stop_codon:yes gene_type:complete